MELNCQYWFDVYIQSTDEYQAERVAESFYNYIDKKLMSNKLTQEEYDELSKKFNSLTRPGEIRGTL